MSTDNTGRVAFDGEHFVITFEYDSELVRAVRSLPQRRWEASQGTWLVEPSWSSVRQLCRISDAHSWSWTPQARDAHRALYAEEQEKEYSVDLVESEGSEPVFQVRLWGDEELTQHLTKIPGADYDAYEDIWLVPADSDQVCGFMLFLFEDDIRFEIPPGAWQEMERGRGQEALPDASGEAVDPSQ